MTSPTVLAVLLAACAVWAPLARGQPAPTTEPADPLASGSGPLEVSIEAQTLRITTRADGTELRRWRTADRLSAGEEVYYTIRVRNPGKQPVAGIVVTKRVPFGVVYARGSATGPACEVQFSLDGGATFQAARQSGGSAAGTTNGKAPEPQYTHLRWILGAPLAPGATALLRFRATFT